MVQSSEKPGQPEHTAPRRPAIYKDLILLQLTVLTFLLDQFSKFLVRELLAFRDSFPEHGFFRFTHTFNTGSAFGLFQDQNFALIFASVAGIAVLTVIYQTQRQPTNLLRLSLGLQLGGATGNLLDRLRMGHVTDFIDVGPWPIFNLADAAIVTGLILLVWMFMMPDGVKRKLTITTGSPEQSDQPDTPAPGEGESCSMSPAIGDSGGGIEGESSDSLSSQEPRSDDSPPVSDRRGLDDIDDGPSKVE